MKLKKNQKLTALFIILGISMFSLYGLVGGFGSNFKFSEINTNINYTTQNKTAINQYLSTTATCPANYTASGFQNGVLICQNSINTASNQPNVSSKTIVTKPNQTSVNGICDANSLPCGSQKFGIGVATALVDSNGNIQQTNTFLTLPTASLLSWIGNQFSLVGPQNQVLDFGYVQTILSGITTSNTQVIVNGQITAYLDNTKVVNHQVYGSGIQQNNVLPLSINGQNSLTYAFKNDPIVATWTDQSVHYYTIYLSNFTATVGTGFSTVSYKESGSFLAYQLQLKVNNGLVTVLKSTGTAVTLLPSDDTFSVVYDTQSCDPNCDVPPPTVSSSILFPKITMAQVLVNGQSLGQVSGFDFGTDVNGYPTGNTYKINNLPRNSTFTVHTDKGDYTIRSSLTQFDYKVTCYQVEKDSSYLDQNDVGHTAINIAGLYCTDNFGG